MKREEAIYCLKAQSERYSEVCEECPLYGQTGVDHCCEDALQLAITALQNQPVWIPLPEPYRESEPHKQTNADRIRSMTDEELADFLVTVETYGYHDQSISGTYEMNEWLLMESEEEDGK